MRVFIGRQKYQRGVWGKRLVVLTLFLWLACRGYWKDPENVEAELRKFMAAQGISGRMPSCTELREAGAFTLYSAISKHGGVGAFAKQLG